MVIIQPRRRHRGVKDRSSFPTFVPYYDGGVVWEQHDSDLLALSRLKKVFNKPDKDRAHYQNCRNIRDDIGRLALLTNKEIPIRKWRRWLSKKAKIFRQCTPFGRLEKREKCQDKIYSRVISIDFDDATSNSDLCFDQSFKVRSTVQYNKGQPKNVPQRFDPNEIQVIADMLCNPQTGDIYTSKNCKVKTKEEKIPSLFDVKTDMNEIQDSNNIMCNLKSKENSQHKSKKIKGTSLDNLDKVEITNPDKEYFQSQDDKDISVLTNDTFDLTVSSSTASLFSLEEHHPDDIDDHNSPLFGGIEFEQLDPWEESKQEKYGVHENSKSIISFSSSSLSRSLGENILLSQTADNKISESTNLSASSISSGISYQSSIISINYNSKLINQCDDDSSHEKSMKNRMNRRRRPWNETKELFAKTESKLESTGRYSF